MILYTIGHRETYRAAIRENGSIKKAPGGFAFYSVEAAREWLERHKGYAGHPPEAFAVFEMETVPTMEEGDCHVIVVASPIIREVIVFEEARETWGDLDTVEVVDDASAPMGVEVKG